jgi:hypothetical protein
VGCGSKKLIQSGQAMLELLLEPIFVFIIKTLVVKAKFKGKGKIVIEENL